MKRRWSRPFEDIRKACYLAEGSLVRYYNEGWRAGYIQTVHGPQRIEIVPIKGFKAAQPRNTTVTLADIEVEGL